ncbi:MAG: hypothetical protein WD751_00520 [Anaerolineales bacterium]
MKLNNSSLLYASGIAGGAAGLASSLPIIGLLNCLLCGWLWLGGMGAVWLYNKREGRSLTVGEGALVGALSGVAASLVGFLLGLLLGGLGLGMMSVSDPEIARNFEAIGGVAVVTAIASTLGLICNLVLYTLFGTLGGLVGAAVFQKK